LDTSPSQSPEKKKKKKNWEKKPCEQKSVRGECNHPVERTSAKGKKKKMEEGKKESETKGEGILQGKLTIGD